MSNMLPPIATASKKSVWCRLASGLQSWRPVHQENQNNTTLSSLRESGELGSLAIESMCRQLSAVILALLAMWTGCSKQPERKMGNGVVDYGDIWARIIVGETKSFVCFSNGTCVILMKPEGDLSHQAIELLKEWGPVHAGSPAGDFSVINLKDSPGWVVTCHHNDILTYVAPTDMDRDANDVAIGLLGRSKREKDATDLKVVHVHDARSKN